MTLFGTFAPCSRRDERAEGAQSLGGDPASLTVRLEVKDASGAVAERSKDFAVAQTGCGQAYVTVRFGDDGQLTTGPTRS